MAREDTFKELDSDFADKLDGLTLKPKPKTKKKEEVQEDNVENIEQEIPIIQSNESPTLPIKKTIEVRNTKITKPIAKINKTFVIEKDIVDSLENVVIDPRTKKKIPGMRGTLSKIVANAIIKELIYIGELSEEEWKDRIQEY